ncbi:uncharacterized protein SMIM9 isoform X2 [Gallus gallus]|uniref:uncharacterized protein SMIM9 isoform X2 n=1 Tax=Gallus gallus TaxID=9031 RepID=UPI0000447FAD|nr:uncharacterized protein SMIM9 isoform X2 [Gallus gallus]XP_040525444.1 uncharacterized protein SMIM9 isoform X2 [Gallus gallus]|eukprot:XP_015133882.1 uncharacterized protein SMIM9 isoform X2 [Gallus gallus]
MASGVPTSLQRQRYRHRCARGRACVTPDLPPPWEPYKKRPSPRAQLTVTAQLCEAMTLRAVLFLIAVLTALFCQHVSKHKPTSQLGGVMRRMRLTHHPGRYLDNTWKVPLRAQEGEGSGQVIQRVRRSWLADYLGDVWFHFSESFPIAVLYIFPVTVLILLFLCCFTVGME